MDAMTTDYNFLESQNGLNELETKLNAHLRELCERNAQLSRRNAELLKSAEIGWNAEVQIKKLSMIEAGLNEEIKGLHFEREMLGKQIREK